METSPMAYNDQDIAMQRLCILMQFSCNMYTQISLTLHVHLTTNSTTVNLVEWDNYCNSLHGKTSWKLTHFKLFETDLKSIYKVAKLYACPLEILLLFKQTVLCAKLGARQDFYTKFTITTNIYITNSKK